MLRRPAKDANGNYIRSQEIIKSPPRASEEVEQLALKLNLVGSKETADMLLQSVGAEFLVEDDFIYLKVFILNGEKIYVCRWLGEKWKYLTDSDLQNGAHSWITSTLQRKSQ